MPPHTTTDVESVLINLIFHTETTIEMSNNESGRRKQVKVTFEDDPIAIVIAKKKNLKIDFQNVVSITSEVRQTGGAIAIRYQDAKKLGIGRKEKTLYFFFGHRNDFQTWSTVLKILTKYKKRVHLDEIVSKRRVTTVKPLAEREWTRSESNTRELSLVNPDNKKAQNQFFNVYGFGNNDWGQLFQPRQSKVSSPSVSMPLLASNVKQLAAGWAHSIVVLENNVIIEAGNRVGTGCPMDVSISKPLEITVDLTNYDFENICCGDNFSLALLSNGSVLSWGSNIYGQLGRGEEDYYAKPGLIEVLKDKNVTHITAGDNFAACLTDKGEVYTWGDGLFGVLGHGDEEDIKKPKMVAALKGKTVYALKAGGCHMLAIEKLSPSEINVYSWGLNSCGQLGLGHLNDKQTPNKIEFAFKGEFLEADCGAAHSAIVVFVRRLSANCLYLFGSNQRGQLGIDVAPDELNLVPFPMVLPSNLAVHKVSCGANHTAVLTGDSQVFVAGCNSQFQLSNFDEKTAQKEEPRGLSRNQQSKTSLTKRTTHSETAEVSKISNVSSKQLLLNAPELFNANFREIEFFRGKNVKHVVCKGNSTFVLTTKRWIDDSEAHVCMGRFNSNCKGEFSRFNRKHHCRNCGGIFCQPCSSTELTRREDGDNKPYRVCTQCYEIVMSKFEQF